MRRDMNLIRAILLEVERESYGNGSIEVDGYDPQVVMHHIRLAVEGELLELKEQPPEEGDQSCCYELTLKGRSFAEVAREQRIWEQVYHRMSDCVQFIPLDVVHIMLAHEAATSLQS